MARRVEQVHDTFPVRKLHDGRRHRNAALLLQLHPVGTGVPRGFAPLHGTRELDRAAVEQQLFRQRRLAGIRVGNDGEGASQADLLVNRRHICRVSPILACERPRSLTDRQRAD